MRMNRGTILLIAALLVVIVAVLVISNQQSNAPAATPTVAVATGPLLPNIPAANIVRYEVRDNTSGNFTALSKDSGGAWHLDATNSLPGRDPDQALIATTAGQIVTINYTNTFQSDQLANFGLDHPSYTLLVTTKDGKLYTIYVGSKSPTSAGYYAVVQQGAAPASTAEPTAEVTVEATAHVTGKRIVPAEQATAEATAQATAEATAPVSILPATVEAAAPVSILPATVEATAEATNAAFTPEATANVIRGAAITLSGQQTIYLIPQTVITTLAAWLTQPPYAPLPTATPTLAPPTAAATAEATAASTAEAVGVQGTIQPTPALEQGANSQVIPAGTPFGTQQVGAPVTAEATTAP